MRPRALLLLLTLPPLLASGCLGGGGFEAPEALNPESCWSPPFEGGRPAEGSAVWVEGRVLLPDGSPHQGRLAWAEAENVSSFWAVATLGLLCLIHDADNNSACAEETTALEPDADGGFRFSVPQEETERLGLLGATPNAFTILARADEGDAWIKADLTLEAQRVTLPTFQIPAAALSITEAGGALVFDVGGAPDLACMSPSTTIVFEADEAVVWRAEGGRLDRRVLEDFAGRAFLEVGYSNRGEGPITRYTTGSPSQPFQGEGAPPSRGADCTLQAIEPSEGCPLTDGDLTEVELSGGDAVVDLGAPHDVSLIALRGSFYWVYVEGSLDGQAWEIIDAEVTGPRALITASTTARYVRVRQTNDPAQRAGMGALAEISIW